MKTRHLATLIGVVTLAASGAYLFIYLYRWEWNRALISGMIFIAAEVALSTLLLSDRLRTLRGEVAAIREARILDRLSESAPPARQHFEWLTRPGTTNVFVPVLLGAGVLLSGIAWLVERVARATARPSMERGLARELAELAPPHGGFLAGARSGDLLRRPTAARPAPRVGAPLTTSPPTEAPCGA